MVKPHYLMKLAAIAAVVLIGGPAAIAQTELRRGVLPFNQLLTWSDSAANTVSTGYLADLQSDPEFTGDYQTVFNDAASILDNYTVVSRGGYFPENAGIPREQQLVRTEAVYRIYSLGEGRELVLYRSPNENTSRYIIRSAGSSLVP